VSATSGARSSNWTQSSGSAQSRTASIALPQPEGSQHRIPEGDQSGAEHQDENSNVQGVGDPLPGNPQVARDLEHDARIFGQRMTEQATELRKLALADPEPMAGHAG
jgi:hypothetical protein